MGRYRSKLELAKIGYPESAPVQIWQIKFMKDFFLLLLRKTLDVSRKYSDLSMKSCLEAQISMKDQAYADSVSRRSRS